MTVSRIQLKDQHLFLQRGVTVPGSVFSQPGFPFKPKDFAIGGTYLKKKIISSEVQDNSFAGFMTAPHKACTYGIASEPDAEKGKYFAAYLLGHYLRSTPNSLARWIGLHEREDLIKSNAPCSFLVITGCYPTMTPYRIERCRDLIEHYSNIPKLVVIGGEDPVTFFQTRLFMKLTHLYFQPSNAVNRVIEVV